MVDLEKIKLKLRTFAKERDWEQFHDPKNLSMALSVEVAELVEIFQWSKTGGLDEINNPKIKKEIEREIADIFNYLIKLVDLMDIDLETASLNKIDENITKYPSSEVKGKAIKYKELEKNDPHGS